MAIKITFEQFEELNNNLIVDDNGHTNKKCPLCSGDVIIEATDSSYTMKCSTENCLSIDCRGI